MIIVTSRIELSLLATALALNFCIGNVMASFAPAISAMEQPVPIIAITTFCMVGMMMSLNFGKSKPKQNIIDEEELEAQTLSMIQYSQNDG